ncbi:MAG: hypothetical protein LBM25_07460 [Bacteroidales bacterium]|jgi:hypothetical protein|nr:hypothetical protein [Bacteroidales bacterium]
MSSKDTTNRFESMIENIVGLPIATIREQDPEQTDEYIEGRLGTKLRLSNPDPRIDFRGNPLLYMGRIINDIEEEFNNKFEEYDKQGK